MLELFLHLECMSTHPARLAPTPYPEARRDRSAEMMASLELQGSIACPARREKKTFLRRRETMVRWLMARSSRNQRSTLKILVYTMILREYPARMTARSPATLEWRGDRFRSMARSTLTPASPECRAMAVLPARLERRTLHSAKDMSAMRSAVKCGQESKLVSRVRRGSREHSGWLE